MIDPASLRIELPVAIAAYLLGSIPFGLVLIRLAGLGDIRAIGSGNIGATNVLRTGKRGLALATLLLDGGKGAAAVLLARWLLPGTEPIAAAAAVLGHLFPVWLGFKGGKGVATTIGALLALSPVVGLFACLIWLATAVIFRFSSLAALMAVGLSPFAAYGFADRATTAVTLLLALLVFIRHRENIGRLLSGQETRIQLRRR